MIIFILGHSKIEKGITEQFKDNFNHISFNKKIRNGSRYEGEEILNGCKCKDVFFF